MARYTKYDTKWTVYGKRADFFANAKKFNIDPVTARVIRNRDIIGDEAIEMYLNEDMSMAHEPSLMKDMTKGCQIMLDKMKAGKKIRIISDYDVDGVTSNYILYKGLLKVYKKISRESPEDWKKHENPKSPEDRGKQENPKSPEARGKQENSESPQNHENKKNRIVPYIDYDIPHRITDGYGINVRMVDKAYAEGIDTIITCDNGIAAFPAVERAKELGMTIIVTDHHDVPYDIVPDIDVESCNTTNLDDTTKSCNTTNSDDTTKSCNTTNLDDTTKSCNTTNSDDTTKSCNTTNSDDTTKSYDTTNSDDTADWQRSVSGNIAGDIDGSVRDNKTTRKYKIVPADAVIDHKQPDCQYPCKELCGAGVAFKFIQLLFRMSGIPEKEVMEYIEYLGIATVCDVMNLVDENRVFVKIALKRLRHSSNKGLAALIRNSGISDRISSFHLGFIIGPCINAAGRLDDARTSLEFLLEEDSFVAETRAVELININNERKDMTVKGTEIAMRLIDQGDTSIYAGTRFDVQTQNSNVQHTANGADGNRNNIEVPSSGADGNRNNIEVSSNEADGNRNNIENPSPEAGGNRYSIEVPSLEDDVFVIYIPGLHESLVGIVAGRIKEKYYRPVLLFTDSEEPGIMKGSGRSIEGYNMYDEINKEADLFVKFGGHEMAAGFSIKAENFNTLKRNLNRNSTMGEDVLTPKLRIDVPMPFSYITQKLVNELSVLEPFGKGNEKPVFAQSGVRVKKAVIMGRNKNVLKFSLAMDNGGTIEAVDFAPDVIISNIKEWFGQSECDKMFKGLSNDVVLDIAYYPNINEFAGRASIQIMPLAYRKHTS